MENASKALIIAGAILLAIVIISLGLVVVNNTRSVTDNANLNAQEIETFNNKFVAYEGANVSGSQVKSLLQTAIASNAANLDKKVEVSEYKFVWDSSTSKYTVTQPASGYDKKPESVPVSNIKTNKTYTVKVSYSTSGLVNNFIISENH